MLLVSMAQLNPKHQLMMQAISWGILDLFEIDQETKVASSSLYYKLYEDVWSLLEFLSPLIEKS